MTATTKPRAWNHNSQVTCCVVCEGTGTVRSQRKASINDPYPERPCEDCDGQRAPECEVCGYDLLVLGYDCLVCDTVGNLLADECVRVEVIDGKL